MNKIKKWLFEVDMAQKCKWIFWAFLGGAAYNIYQVYTLWNDDTSEMFHAAWGVGLFATSALYYSIIIYWMKESSRRQTQITNLIIENHELKHEIMLEKFVTVAKTKECDSLDKN